MTAGVDPIQTEDLAFRARLDSNREPFGPRVGGERRAGHVHGPVSEGRAGPADTEKRKISAAACIHVRICTKHMQATSSEGL